MQRALLQAARSQLAHAACSPSVDLLSLHAPRFIASTPSGSSEPPSGSKDSAENTSRREGEKAQPSAHHESTQHRQPSGDSTRASSTQHSLDQAHSQDARDGRSNKAASPSDEKQSGLAQQHSQQGGAASNDPLAAGLQSLIQSVQARASGTQARAQEALADVRRRVQSTLADTTTSLAARREGLQQQHTQQPLSSRLYSRLQGLSAAVNQLTGYTTVEHLKEAVAQADEKLARLRKVMEQRKQAHEAMLDTQLNLQRDLNALLQKKSSWVDQDVSRFTELCRMEHKTENSVAAAREAFEAAADEVEAAQADLFKAIRERYTEEQLWGDKIRRTATWWTWGLMGLQMLSFMGVIFYIEPRRVRLMQGHLNESLDQHEASMQEHLNTQLESHFEQVCQAVHDSREINVVLHSLDEMQQMGMMGMGPTGSQDSSETGQPIQRVHLAQGGGSGGGLHRNRVGDEKGEELAKVLSAVVSFMDSVNTELGVMRDQLGRLEAAGKACQPYEGAPVFAVPGTTGGAAMQTSSDAAEGVQGPGTTAVGAPQAAQTGMLDRTVTGGGVQGQTEQAEAAEEAAKSRRRSARGLSKWLQWEGRPSGQWSPEQAAGVAAAVGSGVGAVVGAMLVAFFSSR